MLTRSCSSVAGLELFQHFSIADDSSQGWIGLACVLCWHFFESTIALKVEEGGVHLSVTTSVSGHCRKGLPVFSVCRLSAVGFAGVQVLGVLHIFNTPKILN